MATSSGRPPTIRVKCARTLSLVSKKSAGPSVHGVDFSRAAVMAAASATRGSGPMYAQFR